MKANKFNKFYAVSLLFIFAMVLVLSSTSTHAYTTGQSTANLEVPATSKTYHITLNDVPEERWISFNKRIYVPFGDEVYYMYFISDTESTVEYYFTWEDNTIIMDLGETASFDIDKDGKKDITVTVKDIYLETTTVEVSAYTGSDVVEEAPVAEAPVEETPSEPVTTETPVETTETETAPSQDTTTAPTADVDASGDKTQTEEQASSEETEHVSFFKKIGHWFKSLFHKGE